MKFSDIVITANRNLLKNKLRSFLTILAIFVGSFTIILNSAISAGVNNFVNAQIESIGGDSYLEMMPTAIVDQMSQMMGGDLVEYKEEKEEVTATETAFTKEQIEKAKKLDSIEEFNSFSTISYDYIGSENTEKRFVPNSLNIAVDGLTYDMVVGEQPNFDKDAPYQIALTEKYVKPLGFKDAKDSIGKKVYIGVPNTIKCMTVSDRKDCQTEVEATIIGVQADGILSMGGPRVNVSLYHKLTAINTEGMPKEQAERTYLATALAKDGDVEKAKKDLEEIGITAMSVEDEVGTFRAFLDALVAILNVFGGIALIAAAIGIINTLFMAVQERTREIGLMKALGMSKFKIFLSFSTEAISLGFWGSIFGTAISMIIGYTGNAILHSEGMFLETFPTFQLVSFTPAVVIPVIVLVMVIAFIAGTAPAIKAAKKDPIDALRYE